jgi:hypothetical protein
VVRRAREQDGAEQQREQEFEITHGARESRIAGSCPCPRSMQTITSTVRQTLRWS